jgi:ArsR family transcriptional regulator, arsenate/arsenite/antimonite-responsive transcriptional repressor
MVSPASADLEKRADVFKALSHPVRLLMLNLIQAKPRHGEELALILALNPATVSHHLTLLTAAGLLSAQKDQYYQTFSLVNPLLKKTLSELIFMPQTDLPGNVEEDAYRKKVLDTFMRHGRLVKFPAQLKKRQVILEKIAESFEPGQLYPEREVNIILLDFHDDVATLRRGLIEAGLLTRDDAIYQRKVS